MLPPGDFRAGRRTSSELVLRRDADVFAVLAGVRIGCKLPGLTADRHDVGCSLPNFFIGHDLAPRRHAQAALLAAICDRLEDTFWDRAGEGVLTTGGGLVFNGDPIGHSACPRCRRRKGAAELKYRLRNARRHRQLRRRWRVIHPGAKRMGLLRCTPASGVGPTTRKNAGGFGPYRLQASEVGELKPRAAASSRPFHASGADWFP